MGIIESKTFKSGNSVAVRLPKGLGIEAGTPITIERIGDRLEIRSIIDPAAEKRKLTELLDTIRDIWKDAPYREVEQREPIEFPDRPGLY